MVALVAVHEISRVAGLWIVSGAAFAPQWAASPALAQSSGIQSSINVACQKPAPRSVKIPIGTYDIANAITACGTLSVDFSGSTLVADPNGVAGGAVFDMVGLSSLTLSNFFITGGTSAGSGPVFDGIDLTAPMDHFTCSACSGSNIPQGNFISALGSEVMSAIHQQATLGDNHIVIEGTIATSGSLVGTVNGLHLGACALAGDMLEGNDCITAMQSSGTTTTLTLNNTLTSNDPRPGVRAGYVPWTEAFTILGPISSGVSTWPVDTINGLEVGMALDPDSDPNGNGTRCIAQGATISGMLPAGSLYMGAILQTPLISVSAGLTCNEGGPGYVAAAAGFSNFSWLNSVVSSIGQGFAFSQAETFVLAAAASINDRTLTFACLDKTCATAIGVHQPQPFEGAIVDGRTLTNVITPDSGLDSVTVSTPPTFDSGGAYTVGIQGTVSQVIPAGTSLVWGGPEMISNGTLVGQPQHVFKGLGLSLKEGGYFANTNDLVQNVTIQNAWNEPLFITNVGSLQLNSDVMLEGWQTEFEAPFGPPSSCVDLQGAITAHLFNDRCTGATGSGVQVVHSLHTEFNGGTYDYAGSAGISISGGGDVAIVGHVEAEHNCAESMNQTFPVAQLNPGGECAGIAIDASTQDGGYGIFSTLTLTNVNADNNLAPAQQWGIQHWTTKTVGGVEIDMIKSVMCRGTISGSLNENLCSE